MSLKTLNGFLEKWMPLITPFSVIIGIILSPWIKGFSFLIPWIFAFMTFSGSLGSNFYDLKNVLMHPIPILVSLVILYLLIPSISWGLATVIFTNDIYTITGLVLAYAIPSGISSFIWVSIYRGNIALTLSIILISTLLSPLLVPAIMSLFIGANIELNVWGMMRGLIWMLVIPSLIGMVLNHVTGGTVKETLGYKLAPFAKMGLGTVVALNSAVVATYLTRIDLKIVLIALSTLLIASLGYLIGWIIAGLLKWQRGVVIALVFNSGMRNISAGAVLAVTYFPAPVAVPVVIGMLFQQVMASIYGRLMHRYYKMDKLGTV